MKETIVKINKIESFVLWEDKQNWQTFRQTHQEKIESTKLEMKKERLQQDNKQCRNTKDYKRLL